MALAIVETVIDMPCFSVPSRPVQVFNLARPPISMASPLVNPSSSVVSGPKGIAEAKIGSDSLPAALMVAVVNGPLAPIRCCGSAPKIDGPIYRAGPGLLNIDSRAISPYLQGAPPRRIPSQW